MSILSRLVLLVLIAVLPAVGVLAYNEFEARRLGERRVADDAMRYLALVGDEQARVIDGVRTTLAALASAAELMTDPDRCRHVLDRFVAGHPESLNVVVTDAAGRAVCATDPALPGTDLSDRPHVRAALEGNPFVVGAYLVRRPAARAALPFAMPYTDMAGAPAGTILLALDLDWLGRHLADKSLPPSTVLFIADRNGVVLARHPGGADTLPGSGQPLPAPYLDLLQRPAQGLERIDGGDGAARLVAFSPIGTGVADLFVAVGLDEKEALRPVDAAMWRGLLLIAVDLALVMAAAWLGGRALIVRPVARLVSAVERWRNGDRTARAALDDSRSEIGRLGRAFDAMAAELQFREAAREAAHEAERRMAAVLASITDGVLEIDRHWRIAFANARAAALFGEAASAVGPGRLADPDGGTGTGAWSGGNLWETYPEIAGTEAEPLLRRAMDEGRPVAFEVGLRTRPAWFAVRAYPSPAGLAVYVQDVTDRTRAERTVRRAEARYRSVLETAADAMVLIDATGTILAFNRAAERMFGWPADEAIGRNVAILMPEPDRSAHDDHIARYRRTGRSAVLGTSRETVAQRRDGGTFPVELALTEWTDGDERFFTGILRDISERRRFEDALRQAKEEAERANIAKSKFLAAASHDLRQPVQSLVFFAATLGETLAGHGAQGTVARMQQSIDALRQLLEGLLDISRLDAGAVEPAPAAMALGPLLERLCHEYTPRAAQRGLALRVVPTAATVRSDPVLLERVLRNLVENAVRYTPAGRVLIGCRRHGDAVRVVVADTGVGIPPERQDEIFEEFAQLDNPARDRSQGMGLGLAIVRRLCGLLGHPVGVRSQPGRGSLFRVDLPRVAPAADTAGTGTTAPDAPGIAERGLVLVVDDEVIILMGLRIMLQGWGYEVLTATSGEEALDAVRSAGRPPDLILADYRLREGRTGVEAIRAIHTHCGAAVPAIIITGDTAPERIVEARNSGFSLLHKPVPALELRRHLDAAFDGHHIAPAEPIAPAKR